MNLELIKVNAKSAFKANYWACVFAAFMGGMGVISISSLNYSGTNCWMAALFLAVDLLILNPLIVGTAQFFIVNYDDMAPKSEMIFKPFYKKRTDGSPDYANVVINMFAVDVFLLGWYLLLIIPGIVKTYEYALVPYLLAQDTDINIDPCEYTKRSRELMTGHKWQLFMLDLSFIGWYILDVFTFGLLGIFYIDPYRAQSRAIFCKSILDGQGF